MEVEERLYVMGRRGRKGSQPFFGDFGFGDSPKGSVLPSHTGLVKAKRDLQ